MKTKQLSQEQVDGFVAKTYVCDNYFTRLEQTNSPASKRLAVLKPFQRSILIAENKKTLHEIREILQKKEGDKSAALVQQLKERWDRIAGSFFTYTEFPGDPSDCYCTGAIGNPINQLCLEIAEALFPLPPFLALPPVSPRLPKLTPLPDNPSKQELEKRETEKKNRESHENLRKAEIRKRETAFHSEASKQAREKREECIENLQMGEGPYFLLMPTLKVSEPYGQNIHQFQLHEIVLSDNYETYTPLHQAFVLRLADDEGLFRRQIVTPEEENEWTNNKVKIEEVKEEKEEKVAEKKSGPQKKDNPYTRQLSTREQERLIHHSEWTETCQRNFEQLKQSTQDDYSLYAWLHRLGTKVYEGSVSGTGEGKGEEMDAGSAAMEGIQTFSLLWNTLKDKRKSELFQKYPGLEHIIQHLMPPKNSNTGQTRYCVKLLYNNHIKPLLDANMHTLRSENIGDHTVLKADAIREQEANVKCSLDVLQNALQLFIREEIPYAVKLKNDYHYVINLLPFLLSLPEESIQAFLQGEPNILFFIIKNFPQNDCILARMKELMGEPLYKKYLDKRDSSGNTPLLYDIKFGSGIFAAALIQDSNINALDHHGNYALYWAVYRKFLEIIKILLDRGALLSGDELIMAHEQNYSSEEFLILLIKMASLSLQDQAICLTILKFKRNWQYADVPEYIVAKHLSILPAWVQEVNISDATRVRMRQLLGGNEGFILAAEQGSQEKVLAFLALGMDINYQNVMGDTALHWAVEKRQARIINILLENGANLSLHNTPNRYTALNIAVLKNYTAEELLPLLKKIACLSEKEQEKCLLNQKYYSVLSYIAKEFPNYLPDFLEMPALIPKDLEKRRFIIEGNTRLPTAIKDGNIRMIAALVNHGGVNILDNLPPEGNTALHIAIRQRQVDAVRWLLEKDWNTVLQKSVEPYQYPFSFALALNDCPKKVEIISLMLKKMACLNLNSQRDQLQDIEGGRFNSILSYVHHRHPGLLVDILRLTKLEPHNFKDQQLEIGGSKVIVDAVKRGDWPLFHTLVDKGANINVCDQDGYSLLMLAVMHNETLMVDYLLKKNADLCIRLPRNPRNNVLNIAFSQAPLFLPKLLGALFENSQYDTDMPEMKSSEESSLPTRRKECFDLFTKDQFVSILAAAVMHREVTLIRILEQSGFLGWPTYLRKLKMRYPEAYIKVITAPGLEAFLRSHPAEADTMERHRKTIQEIDEAFQYLKFVQFDGHMRMVETMIENNKGIPQKGHELIILNALSMAMHEAKNDFVILDYDLPDRGKSNLLKKLLKALEDAESALAKNDKAASHVTMHMFAGSNNTVCSLRKIKKTLHDIDKFLHNAPALQYLESLQFDVHMQVFKNQIKSIETTEGSKDEVVLLTTLINDMEIARNIFVSRENALPEQDLHNALLNAVETAALALQKIEKPRPPVASWFAMSENSTMLLGKFKAVLINNPPSIQNQAGARKAKPFTSLHS